MPRGEPQLEPVETPEPLAAEAAPVALEAATAAPVAVPYGARGPEGLGGMRDVLALSSPVERRRFVLQLQRTAGNAAVCRWLNAVRERYGAGLDTGDGPDEPPEAPRAR
jgi:hypothetical protein